MRPPQAVLAVAFLTLVTIACDPGAGAPGSGGPTATPVVEVVVPTAGPLVEGLPSVEVLGPAASDAGNVPLFRWAPFAGAATYTLALLGPDGPLWAWQGEGTEIYLGGLPFERPPGWAGPTLDAGACWSVWARDAEGHVIAVSAFLPVAPGASPGHTCLPGTGLVMG